MPAEGTPLKEAVGSFARRHGQGHDKARGHYGQTGKGHEGQ